MQVKADAYEKLDKELLEFVEDVLLNRCENATERMLEYAATLDPKSKPTAVRKMGQVREAEHTPGTFSPTKHHITAKQPALVPVYCSFLP